MRDEIDDILRNRLHDVEIHEGLPSWERIEGSINIIEADKKKKKILFLFSNIYGKAAFVLILIGLGFGGYFILSDKSVYNNPSLAGKDYYLNKPKEINDSVNKIENKTFENQLIEEKLILAYEDGINLFSTVNNHFEDNNKFQYTLYSLGNTGNYTGEAENENISNSINVNEIGSKLILVPTVGTFLDIQTDLITKEEKYYDIDKYLTDFYLVYGGENQDGNKWSSGIFANILTMLSEDNSSYTDIKTQKMVFYDYMGEKFDENNGVVLLADKLLVKKYLPSLPVFADESDYEKLTHNFPLTLIVGISKELNNRVGIESGLVYTFMNSYTGSLSRASIFYNQNLHYIGVPFVIYYSMLPKYSSWDIDIRYGILTEKALSIKGTTTVFQDYNVIESTEYDEVPSSLMLSTNLGIGFGYKLFKDFGIYMEPSMAYYFYTKGQPLSYKTDRPLSFNLKAGIRFNF